MIKTFKSQFAQRDEVVKELVEVGYEIAMIIEPEEHLKDLHCSKIKRFIELLIKAKEALK